MSLQFEPHYNDDCDVDGRWPYSVRKFIIVLSCVPPAMAIPILSYLQRALFVRSFVHSFDRPFFVPNLTESTDARPRVRTGR